MTTDKDGNLQPLMLSDLVRVAQDVLIRHGDMPIGVTTSILGYDDTEHHSLPVSDPPGAKQPGWLDSYWKGRFQQAFVIDGA